MANYILILSIIYHFLIISLANAKLKQRGLKNEVC